MARQAGAGRCGDRATRRRAGCRRGRPARAPVPASSIRATSTSATSCVGRCVGSCDVDVEQLGPPPDCGGVDRPDRHQAGRGAGRRAVDERREDVVGAGRDGDDRRAGASRSPRRGRCRRRRARRSRGSRARPAALHRAGCRAQNLCRVRRRRTAASIPATARSATRSGVACATTICCAPASHGGDRDPPQRRRSWRCRGCGRPARARRRTSLPAHGLTMMPTLATAPVRRRAAGGRARRGCRRRSAPRRGRTCSRAPG